MKFLLAVGQSIQHQVRQALVLRKRPCCGRCPSRDPRKYGKRFQLKKSSCYPLYVPLSTEPFLTASELNQGVCFPCAKKPHSGESSYFTNTNPGLPSNEEFSLTKRPFGGDPWRTWRDYALPLTILETETISFSRPSMSRFLVNWYLIAKNLHFQIRKKCHLLLVFYQPPQNGSCTVDGSEIRLTSWYGKKFPIIYDNQVVVRDFSHQQ